MFRVDRVPIIAEVAAGPMLNILICNMLRLAQGYYRTQQNF